ncbi:MAG: hypothetical protein ACOWYE_17430 [Desulfatiglandales bacterium]
MTVNAPHSGQTLHGQKTLLDVVSRFRRTEAVFRQYDERAGVCLCCEALFETLRHTADKYDLDLQQLLADLEVVVREDGG